VEGRRGAVVEDDFCNKLERLSVQAGKKDKILAAHVQRICELLAITAIFCLEFAYVFRLSVSIRKIASEHPFFVLIYMNSYMFHMHFI